MSAASGFEVVGKIEKGVDLCEKAYPHRASHKALLDSLEWVKGPLFLQVRDHVVGMDMLWLSSFVGGDVERLVPMLRGDVIDKELRKYEKRVLHVGPVFVSLYWVISKLVDLKKNKMVADVPLFGSTITYEHGLSQEEVLSTYMNVRRFVERNLREKKFNGNCFWGFVNNNVVSSNMFVFSRNKKMVHASNVHDGEELDHSFYFELGDRIGSINKGKYVTFFVSTKGNVRYNLRKMKLVFNIYTTDNDIASPAPGLSETIEIPFSNFMLHTRPNAFNLNLECFEGDAT